MSLAFIASTSSIKSASPVIKRHLKGIQRSEQHCIQIKNISFNDNLLNLLICIDLFAHTFLFPTESTNKNYESSSISIF